MPNHPILPPRPFVPFATILLLSLAGCDESSRPPAPATQVVIAPAEDTLDVGESLQLRAEVRDADGRVLEGRPVTWGLAGTESKYLLEVDSTGRVVAVAGPPTDPLGTARVTATSDGVTGQAVIHVYPKIGCLKVSGSEFIVRGRTAPFRVRIIDTTGFPRPERPAKWSSSDTSVASVSASGILSAKREGTTFVVASLAERRDSIAVTVLAEGYRVTPLGGLGGATSRPLDLNDAGQAVGWAETSEGDSVAFLWEAGTMRSLGTLRDWSAALAIDERGTIVGATRTGAHPDALWPAIWEDEAGPRLLFDDEGVLTAINQVGAIAGIADRKGFVWRDGDRVSLPNSEWNTEVYAMDGAGTVAGGIFRGGTWEAVVWRGGAMATLLGGGVHGAVTALNNDGRAVGFVTTGGRPGACPAGSTCAFLWNIAASGTPGLLLGALDGASALPWDINQSGVVVGVSGWESGTVRYDGREILRGRGFVWREERIAGLTELLTDAEWIILEATAINDRGQIAAVAENTRTGAVGAVLLDPPPGGLGPR